MAVDHARELELVDPCDFAASRINNPPDMPSIQLQPPTRTNHLPRYPRTIRSRQPRHNPRNLAHRPHPILNRRPHLLHVHNLLWYILQHRRLHRPRVDLIHRRPVPAQLGRPAPRQALERRLGRAVQAELGEPAPRADGADVDDAVVGGAEAREEGLGEEHGAAHVEVVDGFVVGDGEVGEGFDDFDGGIVDEDVDVGRGAQPGVEGGEDGGWAVGFAEVDFAACCGGAVGEVGDLVDQVVDELGTRVGRVGQHDL